MKVISVHDLELYMRCPRAYKFKVVDESISQQKSLSLCKSITTKRVIFWIHQNKFKVTKEDIKNVKLIYHLVKDKGFTLQGARDFIVQGSETVQDKLELIKSLQGIRDFLIKLRNELP